MGRQIRFFMFVQDEQNFLEHIKQNKDFLLDGKGNRLGFEKIMEPVIYNGRTIAVEPVVYVASFESKIVKRDAFLDVSQSDVIEFWRCSIRQEYQLWDGRIWYETRYFVENDEIYTKPEWLNKKYNEYKKWIVKNYKISREKDFYIGSQAYRMYKEEGFKMMNSPTVSIDFD
jgi:hypothetical protein